MGAVVTAALVGCVGQDGRVATNPNGDGQIQRWMHGRVMVGEW